VVFRGVRVVFGREGDGGKWFRSGGGSEIVGR
jgi:hypothetical protein